MDRKIHHHITFRHLEDPRDGIFYLHVIHVILTKNTNSFAHGIRQFIRDTKSDVSCLQTSLTPRNKKLRIKFGAGRHTTLLVKKNNGNKREMLKNKNKK